ncbi:MAG: hypothetical protein H6Q67_580 [Firmicutes bacterium]|nr:hypothetical protein [Bacillota bacterium]
MLTEEKLDLILEKLSILESQMVTKKELNELTSLLETMSCDINYISDF